MLAGKIPPSFPRAVATEEDLHKANAAAKYYIILLFPWDLRTHMPTIPMTYAGLEDWIASHIDSKSYVIQYRLKILSNMSSCYTDNKHERIMIDTWRRRCAQQYDLADDDQKKRDASVNVPDAANNEMNMINFMASLAVEGMATTQDTYNVHNADIISHLAEMSTQVKIMPEVVHLTVHYPICGIPGYAGNAGLRKITKILQNVKNLGKRLDAVRTDNEGGLDNVMLPPPQPREDEPINMEMGSRPLPHINLTVPSSLNIDQGKAYTMVVQYLHDVLKHKLQPHAYPKPEPLHLFIHGPGGTGKSFFAKALHTVVKTEFQKYGMQIYNSAYCGCAASLLMFGRTLSSILGNCLLLFRVCFVSFVNTV